MENMDTMNVFILTVASLSLQLSKDSEKMHLYEFTITVT